MNNDHPAVREARRLLGARKGRPSDSDRPLRTSHPPRVLPGQLDIFGNVHGGPAMNGDLRGRHSERFRLVSTRFPRRVAEAYDGDLARAAADSDDQVAAVVAAWEQRHGLRVRDWATIGVEERER